MLQREIVGLGQNQSNQKYLQFSKTKLIFMRLGLLLILCLLIGCGNDKEAKHQTVGIICLNDKLFSIVDGFKEHLAELGHIEGKNISYLYECPLKDHSEIARALDNMIAKNVDLLFTMSTPITKQAIKAAKHKNIPIVFTPVYDVIASGIVDDLLHHSENITGVQIGGSSAKALEWLRRVSPNARNLLVPINKADLAANFGLRDLEIAAEKLGIHILIAEVKNTDELMKLLISPPERMDALWLLQGNYLVPRIRLFVEAATRHKVPLASPTAQFKQGVMISYGQRYNRTGRQAGRLAHKILRGVSPKDLPIETADFFLGINLKTAKAAGISIPDDVLIQAEDIIR